MLTQLSHCKNCKAPLDGDYCQVCGQRAREPRRAVIGLVQDVFVETLAVDGKLARTLAVLFTRPGRLARFYIDGKRVRYSTPFRLYLFTSVFFFLAAFWQADQAGLMPDPENSLAVNVETDENVADENARSGQPARPPGPEPDSEADTFRGIPITEEIPDWLVPHIEQMNAAGRRVAEDPRLFIAQVQGNLPRALLLAPLVYALLLTGLYIYRRKFLVYDHFIVSLYMHAALYGYLLAAILISLMPVIGDLWFIPLVWGSFQPIAVFRQAYGSNWLSVILKGSISTGLYFAALALIITLGLSVALYQS